MKQDSEEILFEADEVQKLKDEEQGAPETNEERNNAWSSGGFLVLLGIIFLLLQLDLPYPGGNSWMIWLLVPIYWVLIGAWRQYEEAGRQMTPEVTRKLLWGVFPFIFVFLGFIIGWNLVWPLALIAFGVAALITNKR